MGSEKDEQKQRYGHHGHRAGLKQKGRRGEEKRPFFFIVKGSLSLTGDVFGIIRDQTGHQTSGFALTLELQNGSKSQIRQCLRQEIKTQEANTVII